MNKDKNELLVFTNRTLYEPDFYPVDGTEYAKNIHGCVFNAKTHLTLRRLMSYIYGAPILDVSRSHTTMQHSR